MAFFRRRNLGMLLLGIWLILSGLIQLIEIPLRIGPILTVLAIAAGVFILLDR